MGQLMNRSSVGGLMGQLMNRSSVHLLTQQRAQVIDLSFPPNLHIKTINRKASPIRNTIQCTWDHMPGGGGHNLPPPH